MRADGVPSAAAVASVMALASFGSCATASANQAANRVWGSATVMLRLRIGAAATGLRLQIDEHLEDIGARQACPARRGPC